MKLLLINANPSKFNPVFPIGLDYIASELLIHNIDYDFVDLQFIDDNNWEKTIQELLSHNYYSIVGISIRNVMDDVKDGDWYLPTIKKLVNTLRPSINSMTIIALGGSGLSLYPNEVLEYCKGDVAIAGDGEKAIMKLIDDYKQGAITVGKVYNTMLSKDEFWDKNYTRGNLKNTSLYVDKDVIGNVQTKRGCPSNCSYCSYPVIEGSKPRIRNPKNVIEEIEQLIALGFKEIYFTDSVFNLPTRNAVDILKLLQFNKIKITWHAFHDPKGITQEYLDFYKKTNVKLPPIQLTVESGSNAMLHSLNKNYKIQDIENAIELCDLNGIKYCYSILVGAPGETKSTLDETLEFIRKTKPQSVSLFTGICIHPKTKLAFLTKNILWNNQSDLLKPVFYPVDEKSMHEFILEFNKIEIEFFSSNNYYQSANNYSSNYLDYSSYNNYNSYNYNSIKSKKILS